MKTGPCVNQLRLGEYTLVFSYTPVLVRHYKRLYRSTWVVYRVCVVVRIKAESELIGLTKRVRGLEEDFETTESRLLNTSTKLDEASKASDENERYFIFISAAVINLYSMCQKE